MSHTARQFHTLLGSAPQAREQLAGLVFHALLHAADVETHTQQMRQHALTQRIELATLLTSNATDYDALAETSNRLDALFNRLTVSFRSDEPISTEFGDLPPVMPTERQIRERRNKLFHLAEDLLKDGGFFTKCEEAGIKLDPSQLARQVEEELERAQPQAEKICALLPEFPAMEAQLRHCLGQIAQDYVKRFLADSQATLELSPGGSESKWHCSWVLDKLGAEAEEPHLLDFIERQVALTARTYLFEHRDSSAVTFIHEKRKEHAEMTAKLGFWTKLFADTREPKEITGVVDHLVERVVEKCLDEGRLVHALEREIAQDNRYLDASLFHRHANQAKEGELPTPPEFIAVPYYDTGMIAR